VRTLTHTAQRHDALQVHGGFSMSSLFDSDKEAVRHASVISSLRNRTGAPLAEVRSLRLVGALTHRLRSKVTGDLAVLVQSIGDACLASAVTVPANGFLQRTGDDWDCDRGFRKHADACVPVEVPVNAYLDWRGNDWKCERGFRRGYQQLYDPATRRIRAHSARQHCTSRH
jgi:hypothetical protein